MIYVTGDMHGEWEFRLTPQLFPQQLDMTKEDYLVVMGDFGIWDGGFNERCVLNWLNKLPFTTLFIDGNHENYDILDTLPVKKWHGGEVHMIRPSVIHLMRGQSYDICGKSIFTFGGAKSHDIRDGILEKGSPDIKEWRCLGKQFRINHVSWWARELPSEEEMEKGRNTLERLGHKVDFVFTHCAPSSTEALISHGEYTHDYLTDYLEEVRRTTDYGKWYFGHYHGDRAINERDIMMFHKFTRIV